MKVKMSVMIMRDGSRGPGRPAPEDCEDCPRTSMLPAEVADDCRTS